VHGDRPHLQVAREVGPREGGAAVVTAVRPVLGADEDDPRILGMHGDGLDHRGIGQALGQPLPAVVAHPLAEEPAQRSTRQLRRTDEDVGDVCIGHRRTSVMG
jgi:hypothetical protein